MKYVVLTFLLLSAALVVSAEENDFDGEQEWEEGGEPPKRENVRSWWTRFKESLKRTFEVMKDMWSIIQREASARSDDFSAWWKESLETFKTKVRDWMSKNSEMTIEDKQRLTEYLNELKERR